MEDVPHHDVLPVEDGHPRDVAVQDRLCDVHLCDAPLLEGRVLLSEIAGRQRNRPLLREGDVTQLPPVRHPLHVKFVSTLATEIGIHNIS